MKATPISSDNATEFSFVIPPFFLVISSSFILILLSCLSGYRNSNCLHGSSFVFRRPVFLVLILFISFYYFSFATTTILYSEFSAATVREGNSNVNRHVVVGLFVRVREELSSAGRWGERRKLTSSTPAHQFKASAGIERN